MDVDLILNEFFINIGVSSIDPNMYSYTMEYPRPFWAMQELVQTV